MCASAILPKERSGHIMDAVKNRTQRKYLPGRARAGISAGMDDRPDMLAAQRRREPAANEPVHDLHALDVPRVRHDLDERPAQALGSRALG
jgi:hypothetical protein